MGDFALSIKNRAFGAIFLSNIFTVLGSSLYNIVFLVYAQTYQQAILYISLAEIITIAPAFLGVFTGHLADKTRNKATAQMLSAWAQALLYVALSLLIMAPRSATVFAALGAINFVGDLIAQYKSGLTLPILQKNLAPADVQTAFGQLQGLSALLEIVGQPLGVAILALTGQSFFVVGLVNVGLYVASGLVLLAFRRYLTFDLTVDVDKLHFNLRQTLAEIRAVFTGPGDRVSAGAGASGSASASASGSGSAGAAARPATGGIAQGAGQSNFVLLLVTIMVANFLFSGIGPLFDLGMTHFNRFGLGYGLAITIVNVAFSVGVLLGSVLMRDGLQKVSLWRLILVVFAVIVITMVTLPLGGLLVAIPFFLTAYLCAKINPRMNSLILDNVPSERLGAVSGGLNTLVTFAIPFGGALFVFLANLMSVAATSYLIAGACGAVLLLLVVKGRGRGTRVVAAEEAAGAVAADGGATV